MSLIARKIGGDWKSARGNAKVIAAIESALADSGRPARGHRRRRASGDGRYGAKLMEFAKDAKAPEEVRVAAIEAIGKIAPPKAAEFLDGLVQAVKGKDASTPIAEAALRRVGRRPRPDRRWSRR